MLPRQDKTRMNKPTCARVAAMTTVALKKANNIPLMQKSASKTFLGQELFWIKEKFWVKKILGGKLSFGLKFCVGQKLFLG